MPTNNNKGKRQRAVKLNPAIVKAYAKAKGITSFKNFEYELFKFLELKEVEGQTNNIAEKAWKGQPMDKNRAKKIADFLGLNEDFSRLQIPTEPEWVKLLANYCDKSKNFMNFLCHKNKLELIDFGLINQNELKSVKVNYPWQVKLSGQQDEKIFLLLRSWNKFFLVAPLNIDCEFNNQFNGKTLLYPQRSINFNKHDGIGYRELIAIKAKSIPFMPRHPDEGFAVELNDLERFAHQVLEDNDKKVEVARYSFVLVP